MERRGFLKSLGILGIGTMLNPKLATSEIIKERGVDKKGFGKHVNDKFVNHMSIQRKVYAITGHEVVGKELEMFNVSRD